MLLTADTPAAVALAPPEEEALSLSFLPLALPSSLTPPALVRLTITPPFRQAPVGRWQKNKDLTWYNKDKGSADAEARRRQEQLRVERELVKQQEQDLMAEAM